MYVKNPKFGAQNINLTKGYLQEEKSSPTQICGKEEMQQDFLTSFVIYSPYQNYMDGMSKNGIETKYF